jgi:MFS family permease
VNYPELFFGFILVIALLGLGGFFILRQFKVRYELARDQSISSVEKRFLTRQSRRRLICSVLMVLLGGFLIGWYFIESKIPELKLAPEREPGATPHIIHLVAYYWITVLLVLFGIIALAGIDFFATARYGMHQKKLLEIERRTILEIETARLRERRNDP